MKWFDDSFVLNFIRKNPVLEQFIKFGLIGAFNTLVDFVGYLFFTRVLFWHYLLAAILAFVISASSSFLLNRYWTFKVTGLNFLKEYFKFLL